LRGNTCRYGCGVRAWCGKAFVFPKGIVCTKSLSLLVLTSVCSKELFGKQHLSPATEIMNNSGSTLYRSTTNGVEFVRTTETYPPDRHKIPAGTKTGEIRHH
jgi:hypothetical protein